MQTLLETTPKIGTVMTVLLFLFMLFGIIGMHFFKATYPCLCTPVWPILHLGCAGFSLYWAACRACYIGGVSPLQQMATWTQEWCAKRDPRSLPPALTATSEYCSIPHVVILTVCE